MSNGQRAFWTVLFFTLVGPFFGAILTTIGTPFLIWANVGPFMAGDHPPFDWSNLPSGSGAGEGLAPFLGRVAVSSYIWCAIPALFTGLTLVPHILRKGTVGWIEAGAGGVVCLAASVAVLGFKHGGILVYLCLAASGVAILCWLILRLAGVLSASATPASP